MKISSLKLLILINMMGNFIILSSPSFVTMWLGIELMSFTMPSILVYNDTSLMSKINSWKYFMIQCYSSCIFLLSILCLPLSSPSIMYSNIIWMMMIASMLIKMGMFPFHGWLCQISTSIKWEQFFIISSIQKIGPLIIISESSKMISTKMCLDMMISSFICMMSLSIMPINSSRHFLISSSIINSMWIISASQVSKTSFMFFMIFYFIHLWIIISFMKNEFSQSMDSLMMMGKMKLMNELTKFMLFMSMIGMPPLMGFFMKMSIMEQMIYSNQNFSALTLMMASSILMMMYLKMTIMTINSMRIKYSQFKTSKWTSLSLSFLVMTPMIYFS